MQHGHLMVYLMDDVVSNTSLDRPMEELFFSISLDAGVHPQYTAEGANPNPNPTPTPTPNPNPNPNPTLNPNPNPTPTPNPNPKA